MRKYQLPISYDDCKMTLKETSKNDPQKKKDVKCLSESQLEVYNFDEVKKSYYNLIGLSKDMVGSCDALYISKKNDIEFYLIEFKSTSRLENLKKDGEVNSKIKEKVTGSLLILSDIGKFCISDTRHFASFILVYADAKGHAESMVKSRTGSNSEDDGMKKYEQIYYKQCLIMDGNRFQRRFVDQWEKDVGLKDVGI